MLSSDKSQIIVLHLTKYGDSGAIVHCIDSHNGRSSFLVRGISKSKNSAIIAKLHPLNILDIVSDASPKSSIRYLKEYDTTFHLDRIRGDIYKRTIALFISEVLYRGLHDNVGDEKLYDWLVTSIQMLNEIEGPIANFHLWWLVGFCSTLGFRPQSFDLPKISGVEKDITGLFLLTPTDISILQSILTTDLHGVLQLSLNGSTRMTFAQSMLKYLSFHLGAEITSKSLPVLHDIFR